MDFRYIAAIAMVSICDADPEVSKQAVYKLNGLKSSINASPANTLSKASLSEVVVFVLRLCTIGGALSEPISAAGLSYRIPFREDVRTHALKWVRQETSECITAIDVQSVALSLIEHTVTASSDEGQLGSGVSARYRAVVMDVADVLSTCLEVTSSEGKEVQILIRCILAALNKYVVSSAASKGGSAGALGSFNEDNNMTIRKVLLSIYLH